MTCYVICILSYIVSLYLSSSFIFFFTCHLTLIVTTLNTRIKARNRHTYCVMTWWNCIVPWRIRLCRDFSRSLYPLLNSDSPCRREKNCTFVNILCLLLIGTLEPLPEVHILFLKCVCKTLYSKIVIVYIIKCIDLERKHCKT